MVRLLGVTWLVAGSVVIATIVIYLALIVLVRILGQRSLASMSSFDLGCVVALGAVVGRTVLLETPTLLSGVIALITLFAMQAGLGALRGNPVIDRLMNRAPVLLATGDRLLVDNMRRAHVTEDELRQRLRLAGITRLEQVRCAVLERNGEISVLRRDGDLDPQLVTDVPELARGARTPG